MALYHELKTHIDAQIPAIYIETTEWERFEGELRIILSDVNKQYMKFNPSKDDFVDFIKNCSEDNEVNDIFVIEHADFYFNQPDLAIIVCQTIRDLRHSNKQLIAVAPTLCLPEAIKNEFAIIDFPLPMRDDIKTILKNTSKKLNIKESNIDVANEILDSVKGLGTSEIKNAFAKVGVRNKKITSEEISELIQEKEQIIRKSGYLEYIKSDIMMRDIGGLENLKKWLEQRKIAFGFKARDQKLQLPKGVMLLGIPGTGKSLSAKAVASIWQMPLLRLDIAKIFGSLVGESELNMRNAIKVAESMEPCVLWIDEIEKGLTNAQGSENDGGTSTRVFGTFLTWMQEKQKEVFVFATANDISKLPPELLRKGRFDEVFFVDLPDKVARKKIFDIHCKSINQNQFEATDEILKNTEGYSGAEIESIIHEAHFIAHNESETNKKITVQHVITSIAQIVPLARTMHDPIKKLRELAVKRFRFASEASPPIIKPIDGPIFKQERSNMFYDDRKSKATENE